MKLSFPKVAAAVALALGAQAAMAIDTPSTPPQNGALFISVFDTVAGNSLVQVLQPTTSFGDGTLNYTEFGEAIATPDAGLSLNFNINLSALTSAGSQLGNIRWTVFAGDSTGVVTAAGGQQGVLFTAQSGLSSAQVGLTTANITTMNTQANIIATSPAFTPTALQGVGLSFGAGYFGSTTVSPAWGANYGNPGFLDGSGALDASLGFYYGTKVNATSSTAAPVVQYQNAQGFASWSLSSAGLLTYNAPPPSGVPLPAGVWLLLSGLGGLGVFGRRKAAAV